MQMAVVSVLLHPILFLLSALIPSNSVGCGGLTTGEESVSKGKETNKNKDRETNRIEDNGSNRPVVLLVASIDPTFMVHTISPGANGTTP